MKKTNVRNKASVRYTPLNAIQRSLDEFTEDTEAKSERINNTGDEEIKTKIRSLWEKFLL